MPGHVGLPESISPKLRQAPWHCSNTRENPSPQKRGCCGIGAGEKTDEPFIGELTGKDNRSFVFADMDGFWNGQLDADDALSFCYMHTGGKTTSTVVSCTEVKQTR